MARLARPYIPIPIRVEVAERQMAYLGLSYVNSFGVPMSVDATWKMGDRLRTALIAIFNDIRVELHHRPALVNRRRYVRKGKTFYDPPANDPAHLIYLPKDTHDIETRVRGVGAQRSDLSQNRYNKRVAKNREARKTTKPSKRRKISTAQAKRPWPSRPFAKREKLNGLKVQTPTKGTSHV